MQVTHTPSIINKDRVAYRMHEVEEARLARDDLVVLVPKHARVRRGRVHEDCVLAHERNEVDALFADLLVDLQLRHFVLERLDKLFLAQARLARVIAVALATLLFFQNRLLLVFVQLV